MRKSDYHAIVGGRLLLPLYTIWTLSSNGVLNRWCSPLLDTGRPLGVRGTWSESVSFLHTVFLPSSGSNLQNTKKHAILPPTCDNEVVFGTMAKNITVLCRCVVRSEKKTT